MVVATGESSSGLVVAGVGVGTTAGVVDAATGSILDETLILELFLDGMVDVVVGVVSSGFVLNEISVGLVSEFAVCDSTARGSLPKFNSSLLSSSLESTR